MEAIDDGDPAAQAGRHRDTPGGRMVRDWLGEAADAEALKADAGLEITRMQRGLYLLDTIVGVAPLLGLLGTVYGLFILFPDNGAKPETATLPARRRPRPHEHDARPLHRHPGARRLEPARPGRRTAFRQAQPRGRASDNAEARRRCRQKGGRHKWLRFAPRHQ